MNGELCIGGGIEGWNVRGKERRSIAGRVWRDIIEARSTESAF